MYLVEERRLLTQRTLYMNISQDIRYRAVYSFCMLEAWQGVMMDSAVPRSSVTSSAGNFTVLDSGGMYFI